VAATDYRNVHLIFAFIHTIFAEKPYDITPFAAASLFSSV